MMMKRVSFLWSRCLIQLALQREIVLRICSVLMGKCPKKLQNILEFSIGIFCVVFKKMHWYLG